MMKHQLLQNLHLHLEVRVLKRKLAVLQHQVCRLVLLLRAQKTKIMSLLPIQGFLLANQLRMQLPHLLKRRATNLRSHLDNQLQVQLLHLKRKTPLPQLLVRLSLLGKHRRLLPPKHLYRQHQRQLSNSAHKPRLRRQQQLHRHLEEVALGYNNQLHRNQIGRAD